MKVNKHNQHHNESNTTHPKHAKGGYINMGQGHHSEGHHKEEHCDKKGMGCHPKQEASSSEKHHAGSNANKSCSGSCKNHDNHK